MDLLLLSFLLFDNFKWAPTSIRIAQRTTVARKRTYHKALSTEGQFRCPGTWSHDTIIAPSCFCPSTSEVSIHVLLLDTGKGGGGSLTSSGLPLFGSSDRLLLEKEFALPAERKKAATLEKAAARKVQTAAVKKEEQLRLAA
jgi:hypothetical protein